MHCHTTASDGILTPTELVCLASKLGLKGVGITDHDTIQGWREAEEAGETYQVVILRGIELNTDWQGKEVHILGYELDGTSKYLNDKLLYLQRAREQRMLEILERLRIQGIELDVDEVKQYSQGESIGRPHIAQALMIQGYVESVREAFDRFIGSGAPAYVPRYKLTPEEGIELVREAHGVAVLAHPGIQKLEERIPYWTEMGLQGIEVLHSEHKSEDAVLYRALAAKYGLLVTGGSDFHGEERKPGAKLGNWGMPLTIVKEIQNLAQHFK
jgi:predicted metal-dependent phosphoesterase TrpH